MTDIEDNRAEALALAVRLYVGARPGERSVAAVLQAAGQFSQWLNARPSRLVLRPAPYTFTAGDPGPGVPTQQSLTGGRMSVQMTDAQQVTYTVDPEDSKGFQVADTITWSESSGGTIVTVTPAADGLSAVFKAVAPGTSTISATDGTLSASDAIDVTAGAVASLVLTPGAPVAAV